MKSLLIFVLLGSLMFNRDSIFVSERSTFTHEVLDVSIDETSILVKGWGLLQNKHHFLDASTHSYALKVSNASQDIIIPASYWNADLTEMMAYRGIPRCTDLQSNSTECNYDFKNVGFTAEIPLSSLQTNKTYTISLLLDSKRSGIQYESPIHFYTNDTLRKQVGTMLYVLNTDVRAASFTVFEPDVVVRSEPFKNSNTPAVEFDTCSSGYGKTAFFTKQSVFKDIKRVIQNGLVKSYEVMVGLNECDGYRNRVVEANDKIGYIPSTFIDYESKPLTLSVTQVEKDPELIAYDISIPQYSNYDPLRNVVAYDEYGDDDTPSVNVYTNQTNTRIPGRYHVEYHYRDKKQSVVVTVTPVDVIYRYVNDATKQSLKLWNRDEFSNVLNKVFGQKERDD